MILLSESIVLIISVAQNWGRKRFIAIIDCILHFVNTPVYVLLFKNSQERLSKVTFKERWMR